MSSLASGDPFTTIQRASSTSCPSTTVPLGVRAMARGVFVAVSPGRVSWPVEARLFAAVGFLGSYTTFSTLTVAGAQMLDSGEATRALVNLFGTLAVGLAAAFAGILVGRTLVS